MQGAVQTYPLHMVERVAPKEPGEATGLTLVSPSDVSLNQAQDPPRLTMGVAESLDARHENAHRRETVGVEERERAG